MALAIDLTGRKALVSGVTSGIGAGISQALAQAGCDVAGCGLDEVDSVAARTFVETIRESGRRVFYERADVTQVVDLNDWVKAAIEALGGVDILVSNAGRNFFEGTAACSEEDWQACLNLNLAAHWRLAQRCYPHLKRGQDPAIIIISSNHAFNTIPGIFPYNVTKAGLVALVQSLAIEWGPTIRAVGIAPGFIDTPGGEAWFKSFPDPDAERRRTIDRHPVGRIGTPEEIGALCAFLASSWSSFISGTTILVDGGRSALMQDS